jgi:hypothetical protein
MAGLTPLDCHGFTFERKLLQVIFSNDTPVTVEQLGEFHEPFLTA